MRSLKALLSSIIIFCSSQASFAQDTTHLYRIPNGAQSEINRHQICQIVRNNSGHPILVPTRNAQEWSVGTNAFINNVSTMNGVIVRPCPARMTVSTASCGVRTATQTIQSFFTAAQWSDPDQEKFLLIPSNCNVCLNSPGSAALTIGTSGWSGNLTVVIEGSVTGASSNPSQRNQAINLNRRGAQGQNINIVIDGGTVVAGGFNGTNGAQGSIASHTGMRCAGGGGAIYPGCFTTFHPIGGGAGGMGGRGAHCGAGQTSGQPGEMASIMSIPNDSVRSYPQQVCTSTFVNGRFEQVCRMETHYAVSIGSRIVRGNPGQAGSPGQSGTAGILNADRGNITVINGGRLVR